MKRLLGCLLALGWGGCGSHQSTDNTRVPQIVTSSPPAHSEKAPQETPVPMQSPETPATVAPAAPVVDRADQQPVSPSAVDASGEADTAIRQRAGLEMTVLRPAESATLGEVNQGAFALQVQLKNLGTRTAILWPYLSVGINDSRGKAVPRSMNLGRFGFRSTPSIIEGIPFVSIEPGGVHEIEVNLKQFRYDPQVITGWRFSRPGKYDITLVYTYDRTHAVREYGKGCQNPHRQDAPWNLAIETSQTRSLVLRITR